MNFSDLTFSSGLLLVAALPAQEPADALGRLEQQLSRHAFFRKVDYQRVRDHAPFFFYVQEPAKRQPGYVQRVVSEYVVPLRRLERAFVKEYVEPLQLVHQPGRDFYAFAILGSEGDYLNYRKATSNPGLVAARAHYDPTLQLAVTYEEPFGQGDRVRTQRRAILHEFVHTLQHSYFSGSGELPRPIWFTEGLAEYRSTPFGAASSFADPPLDEKHLQFLFGLLRRNQHTIYLNSIWDLVTTHGPGYERIVDNAVRRAGGKPISDFAEHAFYAQSGLFNHFLHKAYGGRYRPAFLRYMGAALRGRSGWKVFTEAFGGVDPAKLQNEFFAWLRETYSERYPGRSPAMGQLELATVGDAAPPSVRRGRVKVAAAATSFPAAELAFTGEEWQLRLAAAIGLAGAGCLLDAERLLRDAKGGSAAEIRLAQEHSRIAAFLDFRTDLFARAKAASKRLKLVVADAQVVGRVTAITEGRITLAGKKGTNEILLCDVAADELAKQGRILQRFHGDARWIELYSYLVTGRAPTGLRSRLLRRKDPASKELAARRDEYEELRAKAPAAAALARLRLHANAQDAEAARQNLAVLEALLRLGEGHPFVAGRRPVLKRFAKFQLGTAFDPSDFASLGLRGSIQRLHKGRVRAHYDFRAADQLRDFFDSPAEAKRRAEGYGTILTPKARGFEAGGGQLRCVGRAFRRFALPIAAPFKLQFTVRFDNGFGFLQFGFCDDGDQSWIETDSFGALSVVDQSTGVVGSRQGNLDAIYAGQSYTVEIRHDGKRVRSLVNGKKVNEIAEVGSRTSGYITMFVHSNEVIRLSDLTIEGVLDTQRTEALRHEWVRGRMRKIFGD